MGKRFKKGIKKGPKKTSEAGEDRTNYEPIPQENAKFYRYYQLQKVVPDWDSCFSLLKTALPTNFRFTFNASKLLSIMKAKYFPSLSNSSFPLPTPIPWYPNQLAWQYSASRQDIRNIPALKQFWQFLMSETEVGNISRQEAVSMIPPLFLQVTPGHYVLDMCAAPGSKTAQLLEAIHANNDPLPSGLVVANDADYKRSHTLVKQLKRLQSPCLIVTNHEAQFFPYIYYNAKTDSKPKVLQFDRILCDVPCSGDGTIRKNMAIWKNWNQNNGNNLNKLQLSILLRAVHFLKVGGRVVYSTCTFNPVENEAVVAAALNATEGALELLDVSSELPDLKRHAGVSSWIVMDSKENVYNSFEEVTDPTIRDKKIFKDNFPPQNVGDLGLEKCVRIEPSLQDTGAFFVAVFKKVKPFGQLDKHTIGEYCETVVDDSPEKSAGVATELGTKRANESDDKESKKINLDNSIAKSGWTGKGEEPFFLVPRDSKHVKDFLDFYGIDSSFPLDQFVVRSNAEVYKTIYMVSSAVKALLLAENSSRLKIVNTGVKLFIRSNQSAEAQRLSSDGVSTLAPFMSEKRIVDASLSDMRVLLEKEYPNFSEMSETFKKVEGLEHGSFVVRFTPDSNVDGSLHEVLVLPAWRAHVSLSLLVPKEERRSLMARIFGDQFEVTKGLNKNCGAEITDEISGIEEVSETIEEATTEELQ